MLRISGRVGSFEKMVLSILCCIVIGAGLYYVAFPYLGSKDKTTSKPLPPIGTQVGNRAPEIEGEDIQGTKFKLSDYRGKVVMLDFWGNW
jgi:hypothetical protein